MTSIKPIEYLDRPPTGWFALNVAKAGDTRRWDWAGFMVDVDPDELKHCQCKTAFLFVHPDEYKPVPGRIAREVWVRIPGKHRNADAAWDALQDMIAATLH
jgi:hypothetical protein